MRRMKFVAAPLAAVAMAVSGAGVASAASPGEIAGGLGTGMQIGGSVGQLVDMGVGSLVDNPGMYKGLAGVVGTLLGGSIGLGGLLI